ncbi:MAG: helix-turn-helix domain-containing protein [Patescibacteria group bacterium]
MIEELIQLGLSRKEAELYLTLVRYGSSRAEAVSKRVKINRTLVYALLEKLVQQGFVEKITQNGKNIFVPNDPQIFIQKARQQLDQAQFLVKSLNDIRLVKSQPVVRTFQGIEGIKQMTDIFLQEAKACGQEMLQIGQEVRLANDYPELIEEFIQQRVANKIELKLLCNRSPLFDQFLNDTRSKKEFRHIKFVEVNELDVDCTTYICGDSMAVMSLADEMQGYILKSKNITDLNKQMFYLLWNRVHKY